MLLPDLLVIDENNFIVDNNIAKLKKESAIVQSKEICLVSKVHDHLLFQV